MTEDDLILSEDPFVDFDPLHGGIEDPFPPVEPEPEPEPPVEIDIPELPSQAPGGGIGSNNSGWPCACTGLYL